MHDIFTRNLLAPLLRRIQSTNDDRECSESARFHALMACGWDCIPNDNLKLLKYLLPNISSTRKFDNKNIGNARFHTFRAGSGIAIHGGGSRSNHRHLIRGGNPRVSNSRFHFFLYLLSNQRLSALSGPDVSVCPALKSRLLMKRWRLRSNTSIKIWEKNRLKNLNLFHTSCHYRNHPHSIGKGSSST